MHPMGVSGAGGDGVALRGVVLALGPFRGLIKDYQMLVESHATAVAEGREYALKNPRDGVEVRRLDAGLAPVWELFRQYGGLRVVYAGANLLGLADAQPPRPILPLDAGARARIGRVLEGLGG